MSFLFVQFFICKIFSANVKVKVEQNKMHVLQISFGYFLCLILRKAAVKMEEKDKMNLNGQFLETEVFPDKKISGMKRFWH